MQLLQTAREADGRALVAEVALDLAGDREGGEGGEFEPEVRVKAFDRFDQSEVADLDYVVQRLTAILELAREEVDKIVVCVNQLRAQPIALARGCGATIAARESPQRLAGRARRA